MKTVSININRLEHLLKLYRLSINDLILKLNEGVKTKISREDVLTKNVKFTLLKKIDKIFKRGIGYYVDPLNPVESREESIFFRKDTFNAELNFEAIKVVNHFESNKIYLSTISTLSDLKLDRTLPIFSEEDNPQEVASKIRRAVYPTFTDNKRNFLKALISKLSEANIFVHEFVETWNKRERANINGFFLSPNFIVLKRQQESLSREIFTLAHELGHYLINKEEIDEKVTEDFTNNIDTTSNKTEIWCNNFAYYFLIGEYFNDVDQITFVNSSNDYLSDAIELISRQTNLSKIAIYTRLLLDKKVSFNDYNKIKENTLKDYLTRKEEERKRREIDKQSGKKTGGATPKPIISPLTIKTLQSGFFDGIINEYEFCNLLNIKPDKIENYL